MDMFNIWITLYPTMDIIMYKLTKSRPQLSYISDTKIEFKFVIVEANKKIIYEALQTSSKMIW